MSAEGLRGYLLDVFQRQVGQRSMLCAIGLLENGQTFGILDDQDIPGFYVRDQDLPLVKMSIGATAVEIVECGWQTMDGETVLRLQGLQRVLNQLEKSLRQAGVRTYEADLNPATRFMLDRGIGRTVQLGGDWRPGNGVDRAYHNPVLEAVEWTPELAVLSLDIETDYKASQVYAVSLVGQGPQSRHQVAEVHLVGEGLPEDPHAAICYADERSDASWGGGAD
jgi:hypothetical protein